MAAATLVVSRLLLRDITAPDIRRYLLTTNANAWSDAQGEDDACPRIPRRIRTYYAGLVDMIQNKKIFFDKFVKRSTVPVSNRVPSDLVRGGHTAPFLASILWAADISCALLTSRPLVVRLPVHSSQWPTAMLCVTYRVFSNTVQGQNRTETRTTLDGLMVDARERGCKILAILLNVKGTFEGASEAKHTVALFPCVKGMMWCNTWTTECVSFDVGWKQLRCDDCVTRELHVLYKRT